MHKVRRSNILSALFVLSLNEQNTGTFEISNVSNFFLYLETFRDGYVVDSNVFF